MLEGTGLGIVPPKGSLAPSGSITATFDFSHLCSVDPDNSISITSVSIQKAALKPESTNFYLRRVLPAQTQDYPDDKYGTYSPIYSKLGGPTFSDGETLALLGSYARQKDFSKTRVPLCDKSDNEWQKVNSRQPTGDAVVDLTAVLQTDEAGAVVQGLTINYSWRGKKYILIKSISFGVCGTKTKNSEIC